MSQDATLCPYCFQRLALDKVHFRSSRVRRGENPHLPDGYEDAAHFRASYSGDDRDQLLERIEEWEFFSEGPDEAYEEFWEKYGGTTEVEMAEERLGHGYLRRVIDPSNEGHRHFLRRQPDGGYLIRDAQGMVVGVELTGRMGDICTQRVCPRCHNPLPDNYGKHPVKFICVVGVTAAGKTVYLHQLLDEMDNYVNKVGLTATGSSSVNVFREHNGVQVGKPLPSPTEKAHLQQPLFYDIQRRVGSRIVTDTVVMYDVAGEVFADKALLKEYAIFVRHADGIVLLIDPMQFAALSPDDEKRSPTTALETMHNILKGDPNIPCELPIAVSVSKTDMREVRNLLGKELNDLLARRVSGVRGSDGFFETKFNAKEHNPIAHGLEHWFMVYGEDLVSRLYNCYDSYSYFGFTALGCGVDEELGAPVGPIHPRRVEEPLLWLFHEFGYIGANDRIYRPGLSCPSCKSDDTYYLDEGERDVESGWLIKRTEHFDYMCGACGHRWAAS